MSAALLFALGVLIDAVWTLSVRAINEKRPLAAGAYMAAFTAIATGSTWMIVEDRSWVGLVLYSMGGGIGTWWVVRRGR